ncbi:septum formation family protein [Leekyejoonella antrihumi]|nr:septum formation family protein [Leekyejoonella antrihumi]
MKSKTVLTVGTSLASLLLVAGCGSGGGPTVGAASGPSAQPSSGGAPGSPSASSTSPSSSPSPTSTAVSFKAGQCLNDQPSWTDVPCDGPHFYEVASVVKDSKYAGDLVKRAAYRSSVCDEKVGEYLDGPAYGSLLLGAPLPVAADPDNSRQIVCVASQQKADDSGVVARTSSLKGALRGNGFFAYRMCLDGKASSSANVKLVSCTGPHVSEATYGFIMGKWGDKFPGAASINQTSLNTCEAKDKAYVGGVTRDDISFAQNSSGQGPWDKGHRLTVCFVQVNSGTVTGTMRNLRHKSISSIR